MTETMTRTLSADKIADIVNVDTIRVTKVDMRKAEQAARAQVLAKRAATLADMRQNITENEKDFALRNLAEYFEMGSVVNAIVSDGFAKGVRGVAIVAEHTPEEWAEMQAAAKASGTKAQPHRLSVYNRAAKINELVFARLNDKGTAAWRDKGYHDIVSEFVNDKAVKQYSPQDFIAWLQDRETVARTPEAVFRAACVSAMRKGISEADMLEMVRATFRGE